MNMAHGCQSFKNYSQNEVQTTSKTVSIIFFVLINDQ